jgi:hypothetical protein
MNMNLWNRVSMTDPAHTKPVKLGGREFTSIDAQYQVMRATEIFGPVGKGWGYDVVYTTLQVIVPESAKRPGGHATMQFADVNLWWRDESGQRFDFGPVRGCNLLCSPNGHVDEDAPKKAMTDAITKGLSHLGFSADVFLGRYDDNRYVAAMRAQFRDKDNKIERDESVPEKLRELAKKARELKNDVDLLKHYRENEVTISTYTPEQQNWIRLQYRRHKEDLNRQADA